MSKFESKLQNSIEQLILGEKSDSHYATKLGGVEIRTVYEIKKGSQDGKIITTFGLDYSNTSNELTFSLEYRSNFDEDEDYYHWCKIPIPESEEDFFQQCTVNDMLFEYQLYVTVIKAFSKMGERND